MAVSADGLVTEKARPLLQLARSACVDEMRGHEQQQALNMGTAFTLAPDKLEALLLPVTDMTPVRLPAPVFLGAGLADRTVPPRRQYGAVAALCAAGSPLVWKTYTCIGRG